MAFVEFGWRLRRGIKSAFQGITRSAEDVRKDAVMGNSPSRWQACESALRFLDTSLLHDEEGGRPADFLKHLEQCPDCRKEYELRARITERLKQAVAGESESPYLEAKIRSSIREYESRGRAIWGWRQMAVAVAAVLVLSLGALIAYQLGHLRMTAASQEAYIRSISQKVAGILRVGLGDHVHCTVFRKFPKEAPSTADMVRQLGPQYGGLLPLLRDRVPSQYRIIMAHRCSYHGRKFVHLALRSDSKLISLVITRRGEDESFGRDRLRPVLAESGIPVYAGGVQRFSIAAFETREHLAYLVSDLSEIQNLEMAGGLAVPVREFLSKLEG